MPRGTSGVAYQAVAPAAHQSSAWLAAGTAEAHAGGRPGSGLIRGVTQVAPLACRPSGLIRRPSLADRG